MKRLVRTRMLGVVGGVPGNRAYLDRFVRRQKRKNNQLVLEKARGVKRTNSRLQTMEIGSGKAIAARLKSERVLF